MPTKRLRGLIRAQDQALDRAEENFFDDKLSAAEANLRKVRLSEELIKAVQTKQLRKLIPRLLIIVPLACIIVVAALLSLRWDDNRIISHIKSHRLSAILSERWRLRTHLSCGLGEVRVVGADRIDIPWLDDDLSDARKLTIKAGSAIVFAGETVLLAGDTVSYRTSDASGAQWTIKGPGGRIVLLIDGYVRLEAKDASGKVLVSFNDTLWEQEFVTITKSRSIQTLRMVFPRFDNWTVIHPRVSAIGFAVGRGRYDPLVDSTIFSSTILDGYLLLPDVGDSIRLSSGSDISLHGLDARLDISMSDAIEGRCVGRAERIGVSLYGETESVTPSLFTYVFHRFELTFWVGLMTLIGGLIWGTRHFLTAW